MKHGVHSDKSVVALPAVAGDSTGHLEISQALKIRQSFLQKMEEEICLKQGCSPLVTFG